MWIANDLDSVDAAFKPLGDELDLRGDEVSVSFGAIVLDEASYDAGEGRLTRVAILQVIEKRAADDHARR